MKSEINYQLAINGFVRKQAIATKMDFIRPVISKNQHPSMYMSYASNKRHSSTTVSAQHFTTYDQPPSPDIRPLLKNRNLDSPLKPPQQYVGKMSVVTQLQTYNEHLRGVPIEAQIKQDQPGFFDNPYCFQQFQIVNN